jgi:ubiquinone/menaquinone biosynthesis C-methylase UbiE
MISDTFKTAVIEYLKPYESSFNYPILLNGHLDISRFEDWIARVGSYRSIASSTVFSSGCGSAGDLMAFVRAGASKAYGIEVEASLADLGRQRFQGTQYQTAVQIDSYDGEVLPYPAKMFDIVFSMHVIEHTQDPRQYLRELFRVLKPDGVVFLELPNRYYKIEQHTLLPYLHFLPMRLRDAFLKFRLNGPLSVRLSQDLRYKFGAYFGVHFPSPAQVMRIFADSREAYHLVLRDAFFHSYDGQRVPYRSYPGQYVIGGARRKSTFRLVVGKQP